MRLFLQVNQSDSFEGKQFYIPRWLFGSPPDQFLAAKRFYHAGNGLQSSQSDLLPH
jgi:hypothetical protein